VRTGRRQGGLHPGQPEWLGPAGPHAGAEHGAAAPAETGSATLLSGER
jgi:hypothetical protein